MQIKELIAELIGTFTLCFVGIASVILVPQFGIVAPAFAHGLIVVGLIATYGHISGAHINPAVTTSMLVGGQIDLAKAIAYIVVQLIGGVIAAYAVLVLAGSADSAAVIGFVGEGNFNYGQTRGYLTENHVWQAAAIEGILVFFLVSTIYQGAVYKKAGDNAALVIGLTLAGLIFATGGMTGASINPARTLGPVLTAGDFSYVMPYFVGLFAGGALAGIFHGHILVPDQDGNELGGP